MQKFVDTAARGGVLLVNLGSPKSPNTIAVWQYLAQFLSDKRIIDIPRWRWLPILYGAILPLRAKRVAKRYRLIWTKNGAPLVAITQQQTQALKILLAKTGHQNIVVDYAMRYGVPSISSALQRLQAQNVRQLLVIPMYPQYAEATTASVFDAVAAALEKTRALPEIRFVHHWHDHKNYLDALAAAFQHYLSKNGAPQLLLLSFHGVPKSVITEGDPYYDFCLETADLFAKRVHFPKEHIKVIFQSRFGRKPWLEPYADEIIADLPKRGITKIAVMCPGFSADCLETLDEIALRYRALFLQSGGKQYDYIPALNTHSSHIALLHQLIQEHTAGWSTFAPQIKKEMP